MSIYSLREQKGSFRVPKTSWQASRSWLGRALKPFSYHDVILWCHITQHQQSMTSFIQRSNGIRYLKDAVCSGAALIGWLLCLLLSFRGNLIVKVLSDSSRHLAAPFLYILNWMLLCLEPSYLLEQPEYHRLLLSANVSLLITQLKGAGCSLK